jgi:hypothetical protein
MKHQFFVTLTVCQIEIPTFLDSWVTNTLLSKYCVHKFFSLYFRKNMTCLCVGLVTICHVFFLLQGCIEASYGKFLFHERYVFLVSSKLWAIRHKLNISSGNVTHFSTQVSFT